MQNATENITGLEEASISNAPHYTVEGAINPNLNGPMFFKLPNAFQEVKIARGAQSLCEPIALEKLPPRAQSFITGIATLEQVIVNAPSGWYTQVGDQDPILTPGLIGDGDEQEVVKALLAYMQWARNFRKELRGERIKGETNSGSEGNPDGNGATSED